MYPASLLVASLGATSAVEHNKNIENYIAHNVPVLLDVVSPFRKAMRFMGLGRRVQDVPPLPEKEVSVPQEQQDPYVLQEDNVGKEEETLQEIVDEMLADIHDEAEASTAAKNEYSLRSDQVEEAKQLLKKLNATLVNEMERGAAKEKAGNVDRPTSEQSRKSENNQNVHSLNGDTSEHFHHPQDDKAKVDVMKQESKNNELGKPPQSDDKSRMLEVRQNAMEEVLESMAKQTTALRDETERSLVRDLDGLDEKALRYRIAQLTTEFFERIKWEGLRQEESLRQAEATLSKRYSDLLSQQRSEVQLDYEKKLLELEKSLRKESSKTIEELQIAQETRVHNALVEQEQKLKSDYESRFAKEAENMTKKLHEDHNLEVAMLKKEHVSDMLKSQKDVKATNALVTEIHKVVESEFGKTTVSAGTHALSAAVLMAQEVLSQATPADKALSTLKKLSSDDAVVSAVVHSLPTSVSSKGVPVLSDIRDRFVVVREEARKAALAPEGTNPLFAQMIGNVLSFLSVKPSGNVQGDSVEAALSRIDYYLEKNQLDLALKETKSISGYPRTLMSDWERLVHDRLVVDQAVKALKTVSALRHLELS